MASLLASFLDSTLLKAEASAGDIEHLCLEAARLEVCAVCVNPYRLPQASALLAATPVKICTVISFPLGAEPIGVKLDSAYRCLEAGADELDVVMNIGAMKEHDFARIDQEILSFIELRHKHPFVFKYIVETALLDDTELALVTGRLVEFGADFIKTSTGLAARGASLQDLKTIQAVRGNRPLKIKASGGIRELAWARQLIAAGADRIGTSSAAALLEAETLRGGRNDE